MDNMDQTFVMLDETDVDSLYASDSFIIEVEDVAVDLPDSIITIDEGGFEDGEFISIYDSSDATYEAEIISIDFDDSDVSFLI